MASILLVHYYSYLHIFINELSNAVQQMFYRSIKYKIQTFKLDAKYIVYTSRCRYELPFNFMQNFFFTWLIIGKIA